MSMSNAEKDEYIKNRLLQDEFILSGNEILKREIKTDIDESNIKLNKYTFRQIKLLKVLIVLLLISLAFNIYLADIRKTNNEEIEKLLTDLSEQGTKQSNAEIELPKIDTNLTTNNVPEEEVTDISPITQISPKPEIEDVIVEDKTTDKKNYALDLDEELLKEELANYAITIGRFEGKFDTLEENTILLLMVSNNFSSQEKNQGLDEMSTKHALTKENVHLFIQEISGLEVTEYLKSYSNYIGYTEFSNAYVFGTDANVLNNEKYKVLDLKLDSKDSSGYNISGTIQKNVEQAESIYEFKATVTINNEYTYVPYQIKSFTAKLKAGSTDDVTRLVDHVEEVEEK